jgi:tRNA (guanine-N7-)-methyltransferase
MHRTIKSFVLRAGRVSPRQQLGLDEWLDDYTLPLTGQHWDLVQVFGREADTVVEIGFGMGRSLVEMAKASPETNYIGIEVHRAGIGSLVADLHDEGIQNVRIAPFDAVEVFKTCLLPESLAGVQIFFPDPWPKKRHQKRRLVQSEFIQGLVNTIKMGGFLHCATDWEDYALQMLTVLSAEPRLSNAALDGRFIPRPERRPLTKFEHRGCQLGHGVWDLMFLRALPS